VKILKCIEKNVEKIIREYIAKNGELDIEKILDADINEFIIKNNLKDDFYFYFELKSKSSYFLEDAEVLADILDVSVDKLITASNDLNVADYVMHKEINEKVSGNNNSILKNIEKLDFLNGFFDIDIDYSKMKYLYRSNIMLYKDFIKVIDALEESEIEFNQKKTPNFVKFNQNAKDYLMKEAMNANTPIKRLNKVFYNLEIDKYGTVKDKNLMAKLRSLESDNLKEKRKIYLEDSEFQYVQNKVVNLAYVFGYEDDYTGHISKEDLSENIKNDNQIKLKNKFKQYRVFIADKKRSEISAAIRESYAKTEDLGFYDRTQINIATIEEENVTSNASERLLNVIAKAYGVEWKFSQEHDIIEKLTKKEDYIDEGLIPNVEETLELNINTKTTNIVDGEKIILE